MLVSPPHRRSSEIYGAKRLGVNDMKEVSARKSPSAEKEENFRRYEKDQAQGSKYLVGETDIGYISPLSETAKDLNTRKDTLTAAYPSLLC